MTTDCRNTVPPYDGLDGPQSPAAFLSPPLLTDYQSQLVGQISGRIDADRMRAIKPDSALLTQANRGWLVAGIPELLLVQHRCHPQSHNGDAAHC